MERKARNEQKQEAIYRRKAALGMGLTGGWRAIRRYEVEHPGEKNDHVRGGIVQIVFSEKILNDTVYERKHVAEHSMKKMITYMKNLVKCILRKCLSDKICDHDIDHAVEQPVEK